ncbi:BatA domain-containing protein [Clostridium tetanomorphum]|uniref:BatA domain-containing protein n=1 Tax=Clostridium tetanomorphum TaxID=1553 RepID=UPI000D8465A0|nr:BatA domain-containing protein [Clostridium tetanomorphum]SQC01370.1 membrane-associated protein [Clostridium tetanomorphum]
MFFLNPLRLIGLLALTIIVLIHLKNRKLKEIEVSSIKLWDKVFEEIKNVSKKE